VGGLYGTSLQAAASQGNQEAIEVLIEAGADIDVCGVGKYGSALMAAIEGGGYDEVIQVLVDRRIDINCPVGPPFEYPLTAAATHDWITTFQILIDAGANVNNKGGMYATALQAAAAEGNEEIVRVLLEHGAEPNIVGGKFGTALQAAYASGYYLVISELLKAGASVHLGGGQYGRSLSAALENSCATLVSALLRHHGADPKASVRKYGTPLQQCLRWRPDDSVFEILLDVGADVNAQGGVYGNALICAVIYAENKVSALLDAGADVNLDGNATYPTAVHAAAKMGQLSILRLLVENGAHLEKSDGVSSSPVEYASSTRDNFSVFLTY
jgi:ankyrin repeat protein